MTGNNGSFASMLVQVGDEWCVRCSTYDDQTPILAVDAGSTAVTITTRGKNADDNVLKFARELLQGVQTLADDIERMHAEQTAAAVPEQAEQPDRAA